MRDINYVKIVWLLIAAVISGCGGSGSSTNNNQAPPAPVAQTTVGQITGFGSVYVNGIEYDSTTATYDVDDVGASGDDALAVGMVVKIQGSVNADGRTGTADSITYDDDIEGIVDNLATDLVDSNIKTFSVMGVPVSADKNRTNFEGEDDPTFSFGTMMDGDNIEVSGEFNGDVLIAFYIEKQDSLDDDFEAKGTVDQYDGATQFVLILRNSATLDVTIADGADIPNSGVMDGQYVEIEGTIPDPVNAPTSIDATKVEIEDHDRISDGDEDEVEIKGTLSYDVDTGTWSLMDVELVLDENTEYSPESLADSIADTSADGLYVEADGQYVNDALQVHEIELEEDDLEFKADVEMVSAADARNGTLNLSFGVATGTIDVNVTADTLFLDDEAVVHHDMNSIMMGDKLEIKARLAEDGMIYASTLHSEDDTGYEIEGPVEMIDDVSISVLGISFVIDMNTFFADGIPVVGDYVEVEDGNADGTADSVEIDD